MITYPDSRREPLAVKLVDGSHYLDDFAWLEQPSDDRTAWLEKQNALTDGILGSIPEKPRIRARLEKLLRRVNIKSETACSRGNSLFYAKRNGGERQHSLYVLDLETKEERCLVDLNKPELEARSSIGGIFPSPDGKFIVYEVSRDGDSFAQLQVMDVSTGELIDQIPRSFYSYPTWKPDNSGFFYSRSTEKKPEELRQWGLKVHFHKIGDKWEDDCLVYGSEVPDSTYTWANEISRDGRHLIITQTNSFSDNELLYLDLTKGSAKAESITGDAQAEFDPTIVGDHLYIKTNHQAPGFKLGRIRLGDSCPKLGDLEIVVDEGVGFLTGFRLHENRLYLTRKTDVSSHLYVLDGSTEREIDLGAFSSISFLRGDNERPVIGHNSFLDPFSIYQLDGTKSELILKSGTGLDHEKYCVEQLWTKSDDGTKIPMFVVRKRDLELNGNNPTIMYGYGGFGRGGGIYPGFSDSREFWLENGGISVIANIRGGDEYEREWHHAGRLDQKQNVFRDFIACAEALQGLRGSRKAGEAYDQKAYTSNKHLGIMGESNGGLLTCATLVQRPDLVSAVISGVPFTDMLRFTSTDSGKAWMQEYGNPEDPEQLRVLLGYSPYHNVERRAYPATYIYTASHDTQGVDQFHAMKMAAMLQDRNTSEAPMLLRYRHQIGHGHGESLSQQTTRLMEQYAIFTHYLGLKVN